MTHSESDQRIGDATTPRYGALYRYSLRSFPLAFMNEKPSRNEIVLIGGKSDFVSNLIQTRRDVGLRLTHYRALPPSPPAPGVLEDPDRIVIGLGLSKRAVAYA